jgi:hypothetical protein
MDRVLAVCPSRCHRTRIIERRGRFATGKDRIPANPFAELLLKTSSFAVGQSLGKEPPRSLPNENASHPDGAIVDRDLNATPILPITEDWGESYTHQEPYTPEEALTQEQ